jgi:hypothetical protein
MRSKAEIYIQAFNNRYPEILKLLNWVADDTTTSPTATDDERLRTAQIVGILIERVTKIRSELRSSIISQVLWNFFILGALLLNLQDTLFAVCASILLVMQIIGLDFTVFSFNKVKNIDEGFKAVIEAATEIVNNSQGGK